MYRPGDTKRRAVRLVFRKGKLKVTKSAHLVSSLASMRETGLTSIQD